MKFGFIFCKIQVELVPLHYYYMATQSQHISQELKQSLKLSPAQIKFGKILGMTTPEFEEEVARTLEENPALEAIDYDHDSTDDHGNLFNETADELQRADFSSDEEMPQYMLHQGLHDRDYKNFDAAAVEPGEPDLSVLEVQLADLDISDYQRLLCRYIIGNLDSNGYLTRSAAAIADDLAMSESIDVQEKEVKEALDIVRSLDPAGIAATDLRDCLLLQLDRLPERRTVSDAKIIVSRFFNDIALHNIDKISKATGLDYDAVSDAFDLIKTLNPRPGASIEPTSGSDKLRHIYPDFIIDTDPSGMITIQLAGHIPELRIEASFNSDSASAVARDFIKERRDSAEEFISMTRRRSSTLMTVMTTIISLQPEYFRTFDKADLRPMVLKDIAEATGLDISTVSRAVSLKYALTPFGTIALKSLFSASVSRDTEIASQRVHKAIRDIIDSEDKSAPLSDIAIADRLRTQGLNVARRTITKYREEAGIPSSHYRKR